MTTPFDDSGFDVDVQVQRERLARTKEKMQKEQEELVHDLAEALRAWYPKEADRIAAAEPEITAAVRHAGRVEEVKQNVSLVVARAEAIARERLSARHLWWHVAEGQGTERTGSPPYKLSGTRQLPQIFVAPVRRALGALAVALEPFGYLRVVGQPDQYLWREGTQSSYSSSPNPGATPYYHGQLPTLPEEFHQGIAQYDLLLDEALNALAEIRKVEAARKAAAAKHVLDQRVPVRNADARRRDGPPAE
jgi:molybdopterin converting factor small subunit